MSVRQKILLSLISLLFLVYVPAIVSCHDVVASTNAYFTIPTYSTQISFDSEQTFDTVYREATYWYFDNYKFSIEDADATITTLFTDDLLEYTTTAAGTFKVNPSDAGYTTQPKTVDYTGGGVVGWTWSAGELTVTYTGGGSTRIDWSGLPSTGSAGMYKSTKIDTYLSISPVYTNLTLYINNQTRIEGTLKTSDNQPVHNANIKLASGWGFTNQTLTGATGNFKVGFTTPEYAGQYELTLTYKGDATYNPSVLDTTITINEASDVGDGFEFLRIRIILIAIIVLVALVIGASVFYEWLHEKH